MLESGHQFSARRVLNDARRYWIQFDVARAGGQERVALPAYSVPLL